MNIHVELNDYHNRVMAALDHEVDPTDILIRHTGERCLPYTTLHPAADSTRCINIAFVAEGYQADEMPHFLADAEKATRALFAHRPFSEMSDRFNIIAVREEGRGFADVRHRDKGQGGVLLVQDRGILQPASAAYTDGRSRPAEALPRNRA